MKRKFVPIAWLLAAMMVVPTLASCAQSDEQPEDTTAASVETTMETTETTETTELSDGLNDVDMDGFVLSILNNNFTWAELRLDASADETADVLSEAIYKRSEMIGERFNASLKVAADSHTKTFTTYTNLISAGETSVDIGMIYSIRAAELIPYVADFNQVPHISLGEPWWTPNATEIFHLGDKQIAAAGAFSLSYVSTAVGLAFNKELYKDLNTGEDLYDLVRDGTWTLDKFFSLSIAGTKDLNGDGVIDDTDQYGMAGAIKSMHHLFVIGSDCQYITMDKDNFPVFTMDKDEKLIGLLERLVNFHITNPSVYRWTDGVDKAYPDTFKFENGRILFYTHTPHQLSTLREMKDDFGFVPGPKYSEEQEQYFSNMSNGEVATLPRTFQKDRLENIGILLEAMSFYTQKDIIPVYKDVVLDMKVTRDADSAEMLDIIFAGATYDYGINVWQSTLGNKIMTDLIYKRSDAIVSYLTSLKPTLESAIASLKDSIAEMP